MRRTLLPFKIAPDVLQLIYKLHRTAEINDDRLEDIINTHLRQFLKDKLGD